MSESAAGAQKPDDAYYSCEYIEGGIVFYPNRITACCVSHSDTDGTRGQPRLTEFKGGELPMEKIYEWRNQTIAAHKRGEFHPDCKGCPLLAKGAWGNKSEHSIHMITIAHFSHCNLRCGYCYTVTNPE